VFALIQNYLLGLFVDMFDPNQKREVAFQEMLKIKMPAELSIIIEKCHFPFFISVYEDRGPQWSRKDKGEWPQDLTPLSLKRKKSTTNTKIKGRREE
jgi:hypothetical protein